MITYQASFSDQRDGHPIGDPTISLEEAKNRCEKDCNLKLVWKQLSEDGFLGSKNGLTYYIKVLNSVDPQP